MYTFLLIGIIFILLIYHLVVSRKSFYFNGAKHFILFVTAHPDDECMFFAPTILNLLKEGHCIYLLCLSAGGFYNKSTERKRELRESCQILGIPSGNVIVIEHSKLPDNPDLIWNSHRVAVIIRKYVSQLSAKIVISFDEQGVSGHLNHIAIYKGLKYLKSKELLPNDCQIYQLESVSLLLKYMAFFSVPFCLLCCSICFISTFKDVQKTWLSMKAHKSQLVWFRKLYIIFSRYVYFNTYKKLVINEKFQ